MRSAACIFLLASVLLTGCVRSVDLPEQLEGATLVGQVVVRDATTGDWRPEPDVLVRVLGSNFRATSNDDGTFRLDRLPLAVPLNVELSSPAAANTPARQRVLDPVFGVVDGQSVDLGIVRLGPVGSISGRILGADAVNLPPVGREGALVVAVGTPFRAVSDADGAFVLSGIPEGTFDVTAFLPGFRSGGAEGVQVRPASTTELESIVLARGETATVTVSNTARRGEAASEAEGHAGINLEFVRVPARVSAPALSVEVSTADDGRYTVELPVGVYDLTVSAPDIRPLLVSGVAVLEEGVLGLPALTLFAVDSGDLDGDGVPDGQDPDPDNDGCVGEDDDFDDDPTACKDTDGDGAHDGVDDDDDDDGLLDAEELSWGADGWITNPRAADTDGDSYSDLVDVCPTVPDDQTDDNGDGIGDACQDIEPSVSRPRPTITSVTPMQVGRGQLITINGENLQGTADIPTVVQFGFPAALSAVVSPEATSAQQLQVLVPPSATNGQVVVFANGFVATSPSALSVRPSPTIVEISPRAGRVGSRLRVIGRDLSGSGLLVEIGGETATIIPHPEGGNVIDVVLGGERYQQIEVVVPRSSSNLVTVHNEFGSGASAAPFQVLDGGVEISSLIPATVPAGATLRVQGQGFATDDLVDPGPVQVLFNVSGTPISQAIEPGSSDRQLLVTVPLGAESDFIAVEHPALTTPARSASPLVIDPLRPAISRTRETLVRAGDTLEIFGTNLDATSGVTFTGGATSPNVVAISSGEVHAEVPAGVAPGPFAVTTPNGTSSTAFGLSVLEVGAPLTLPSQPAPGGGSNAAGTEIYLLNRSFGYLVRVTPTGLQLESSISLGGQLSENIRGFSVSPSGSFGVAIGTTQSFLIDLPSFQVRSSCPLARPPSITKAVHFDESSAVRAAYVRKASSMTTQPDAPGLVRIDLDTGTCAELDLQVKSSQSGGSTLLLALPDSREILVVEPRLGWATVNADPASPAFGTLNTPFSLPSPAQPFVNVSGLERGLNGDIFLLNSVAVGLRYFHPQAQAIVSPILQAAGDGGELDGVGRFMMVAYSSAQIVDTTSQPPVLVRRAVADVWPRFGHGLAGRTAWVLGDQFGTELRRVEVFAP